jgi:hypothetical protein
VLLGHVLVLMSLVFLPLILRAESPSNGVLDCGESVVNRPDLDATPVLQACVDFHAKTIRLFPGRYYLRSMLDLKARSDLTIQTLGVESGPPCLAEKAAECAVLVATRTHPGPFLLQSQDAKNLTLKYIALDGNIAARRVQFGDSNWPQRVGYNAIVHGCKQCSFIGFASVRAVQGTGLEFDGDDALFSGCLFRDNGWDIHSQPNPQTLRFADGLTVWNSQRVRIVNSRFENNSDINLILGNAPQALIENNIFLNSNSYAFAALMLDNFNGTMPGSFEDAIIRGNKIDCGFGMCGIGLNVGPHMWYASAPVQGGTIDGTTIRGARQGILTNGATGTRITRNQILTKLTYRKGKCVSSPISFSKGDQVTFENNSASPTASRLSGCGPQDLAASLNAPSGVDARVAALYRDVLARDPDGPGGRELTRLLNSGTSLQTLRDGMALSAEARTLLSRASLRYLGRQPREEDYQVWGGFLARYGNYARFQVVMQMSDEALARENNYREGRSPKVSRNEERNSHSDERI